MDSSHEFWHPALVLTYLNHRQRNAIPLPLFDNRRGTQGQEPHHRAHLEPRGTAIGELQKVIVEAVLLVPHAFLPGAVHGRGDIEEVLYELQDHVFVDGVVGGELHCEFEHVLGEECHPRRAIRLFQVAAGGKWSAAVEDPDVVEAEETPFEYILTEPVLAVHPPCEVQNELVERRLEEIEVSLPAQGLLGPVQEQSCPCMEGGFTSLKFHS